MSLHNCDCFKSNVFGRQSEPLVYWEMWQLLIIVRAGTDKLDSTYTGMEKQCTHCIVSVIEL